jgi:hypothetical protein
MTWDGFKGAVRLSVCEAPRHDSRTVLSFMVSRRQRSGRHGEDDHLDGRQAYLSGTAL